MQLRHVKSVFLAVTAIGLALLAMMIVTEGEPGALPLALVLGGSVGYVYCWVRQRRSAQSD